MPDAAEKSRAWVVPRNDLESAASVELLIRAGEMVLITRQPWGASWSGLEPDIQASLEKLGSRMEVIGVELAGGSRSLQRSQRRSPPSML